MRLITWDQAIGHLKLTMPEASTLTSAFEADIRLKIDIAEALVLDHVDQRLGDTAADWSAEVALWNADETVSPREAVPPEVQGAVLIQLAELHRFRGDDNDSETPRRDMGTLHPRVVAYLYRKRDPAVA